MPKSKRHRAQKRHTRPDVFIPIAEELRHTFQFDAHGALAAMMRTPNEVAYQQLWMLFNNVHNGLTDIGQPNPVIASGIRTMKDVGERARRLNVYRLARHEELPIQNAVNECAMQLPKLDVISLHLAGKKLSTEAAAML